jgi:hypothetical protein
MNVEIRAEAALFPEKEYISGIFVAVWVGIVNWQGEDLCSMTSTNSALL